MRHTLCSTRLIIEFFRFCKSERQLQPRPGGGHVPSSRGWSHRWGRWHQAPGPWSPHPSVRPQPPRLVLCPVVSELRQPGAIPPTSVRKLVRPPAPRHHLSQVLPLLRPGLDHDPQWPIRSRSRAQLKLWLEELCSLRSDPVKQSVSDQKLAPRRSLEMSESYPQWHSHIRQTHGRSRSHVHGHVCVSPILVMLKPAHVFYNCIDIPLNIQHAASVQGGWCYNPLTCHSSECLSLSTPWWRVKLSWRRNTVAESSLQDSRSWWVSFNRTVQFCQCQI